MAEIVEIGEPVEIEKTRRVWTWRCERGCEDTYERATFAEDADTCPDDEYVRRFAGPAEKVLTVLANKHYRKYHPIL